MTAHVHAARMAEYARYRPYCSYHCQQWAGIDSARRHLATLEQAK